MVLFLPKLAGIALLAGVPPVQNPNFNPDPQPIVLDFSSGADLIDGDYERQPAIHELDAFQADTPDAPLPSPGNDSDGARLPAGLAQVGGMVVPEEMLDGAGMVPQFKSPDDPVGGSQDLDEICAFPDEVPAGVYDYEFRPGGERPRFHTVFLNYNGGVLQNGGENSAENMSTIALSGHEYPVYAGGEQRAIAVAQAVTNDFAPWAVRIMYETRPPKVLPYTMVMMGGSYTDTTAGPSGGVAPLDCEDYGQRNVCYVFQNISPATTQANTASQEIGHTLGLGHTNASDSVMAAGYAPTQGGDLGFNQTCANTIQVQGQSAACVGVNKCHCGDGEHQHDHNTLSVTFAAAGPDMVEPTIEITEPADGETFETDDEVWVRVNPWDDVGGYGWKMMLEDASGEVLADSVDYDRAMEWKLVGLPVGEYTITTLVQDHADHQTTDVITINVVEPGNGDGSETESGSGGETDSMGDTDGDGPTLEGGDEDDAGEMTEGNGGSAGETMDDGEKGCACRSSEAPLPVHGALLLLLLGLRRRSG